MKRKKFSSKGALLTHEASKKHKQTVAAQPAQREEEDVKMDEDASHRRSARLEAKKKLDLRDAKTEEDVARILDARIAAAPRLDPKKHCLFCSHLTETLSLDDNLEHMKNEHSFFVPQRERLSDAEGLLNYLGEKISVGNMCLVCNDTGKCFHSVDSVRKHMIEKGHCRIPWSSRSNRAELADFYTFTAEDESMTFAAADEDDDDDSEGWESADDMDEDVSR